MSDSAGAQSPAKTVCDIPRWIAGVLIVLVLGAALVARLHDIGRQCLWMDELMSLEMTGGHGWVSRDLPRGELIPNPPDPTSLKDAAPWWRIIPEMKVESHPPLYYVLLRGWREAFGSSETAVRLLSTLFSLLAIYLLYDFTKLVAGRFAGLWAAIICALASPQIIFAQEVRSYTLLLATTLWCAAVALRIERDGLNRRRGILFAISVLTLMFTHYFAVASLAAIGVYLLVQLRGKTRIHAIGIMCGAGLLVAAIWGPMLIRQVHAVGVNDNWLHETGSDHLSRTLERVLLLPMRFIAEPVSAQNSYTWAKGAAIMYLIFPLVVIQKRKLLLPLLLFLSTIVLLLLLDLTRSTNHLQWIRFSLPSSIGEYCLLAALLGDRKWLRHLLPALVVCYAWLSLGEAYKPWKENWREISKHIDGDQAPLVIHANTKDFWESTMFLGAQHYTTQHRPIALITQQANEHLMEQLRPYHEIWLLEGYTSPDPTKTLPGAHVENTWLIEAVGKLVRVRVD